MAYKSRYVPAKLRDAFCLRELFYPANLLSFVRLLMLVPTLTYLRQPDKRWQALACMNLAMLTDALDGPLARHRGEESQLGKILDPIADKLLIDGAALTLSQTRNFPWWMTGLLLFRDAGILLSALLVYRRRARITPPQLAGKAATVALTAALVLYTADGSRSGRPVLYVALVPFVLSFLQYGHQFIRLMSEE